MIASQKQEKEEKGWFNGGKQLQRKKVTHTKSPRNTHSECWMNRSLSIKSRENCWNRNMQTLSLTRRQEEISYINWINTLESISWSNNPGCLNKETDGVRPEKLSQRDSSLRLYFKWNVSRKTQELHSISNCTLPCNIAVTTKRRWVGCKATLKRVCSQEYPRAPFAFENLMIHWILQFAWRIAVRCVLHRCGNQDIRC